ncbi:unnamed protein product [Medioppia subpectinata]|uniref:CUB domain-containing protein n=1 Tax=Medioppia subpectinata TaxID=1979941 RepID=A0A7R9PW74_9ACAR|nr:unnamed protein product [Medioppia subpectinata]CAG2103626.1 unnamed protein product [Medioppia subpectinata]
MFCAVQINSSGNDSVLVITAYLYEGLKLTEGFECHVMVTAPRDMGIVTTIKKASFHDNDTFYFRSGSNPEKAWSPQTEDYRLKEIVAVPNRGEASNIFLRFKPSTNRSQHNAGFEIAFTAFKEKGDSCGDDFDCGNDRCVWSELVCDGYNNCGNEKDESGCAGVSLWVIILLIGVGILVVMLAIFVWYRMAQR